jgi:hypothetical protein
VLLFSALTFPASSSAVRVPDVLRVSVPGDTLPGAAGAPAVRRPAAAAPVQLPPPARQQEVRQSFLRPVLRNCISVFHLSLFMFFSRAHMLLMALTFSNCTRPVFLSLAQIHPAVLAALLGGVVLLVGVRELCPAAAAAQRCDDRGTGRHAGHPAAAILQRQVTAPPFAYCLLPIANCLRVSTETHQSDGPLTSLRSG